MSVLQMDRCHYCGTEVFFEEDTTLTKCQACGHTLRIADFLSEQIKLKKALEAEAAAKQELAIAKEESKAARAQLDSTLQTLGDLRNSNNLREEQLRQVLSSLDISKENQDALGNMLQKLGQSGHDEHSQIVDLIRIVIDHQDTMTDKLQVIHSFSQTLLENSNNTLSLISFLSEHLHTDTASMNQAIDELVSWTRSVHDDDLAFLENIQNASNALLESQRQSLQKISDMEKRQKEAADRLARFESNWEKQRLDEIIALYHQAENLQADREYERAADYYRQVVIKGGRDPEVLWRIIQCHYGVNAQIDNEGNSIITLLCPDLTDPEEMSIRKELANSLVTDEQKSYYNTELEKIDSILDKYRHYRLEVDYDIFISVKQKDDGHYTEDSDIGSELYYHLINRGYKVFNSRRTIPAGVEYEPYILAALLSARVLIVVGSCPEYINSQWVKNEWSRFQWFQKHETDINGSSDRILLCYLSKGMDPYTIPKALNPNYQAIIDGLSAERQLTDALNKIMPNPGKSETAQTATHPQKEKFIPAEESTSENDIPTTPANVFTLALFYDESRKGFAYKITHYNGEASVVRIPRITAGKPITRIDSGKKLIGKVSGAFEDARNLTNVILPDTLTYIGKNSFKDCSALREIQFPPDMETIGEYAFAGSGLTSVTLPASVTRLARGAFQNCSELTEAIISESIEIINADLFSECRSLTHVSLPDSIKIIEWNAFQGCCSMTHITLPNSLLSIRSEAFAESGLVAVRIPDSVTEIGPSAFCNCYDLEEVVLPFSIREISDLCFQNCLSLKQITLPASIVYVSSEAFKDSGVKEITILGKHCNFVNTALRGCYLEKVHMHRDAQVTLPKDVQIDFID